MRTWKLRKLWNKAREAAGYPTLRIHDLRHSRISASLVDNPPHVVRDIGGPLLAGGHEFVRPQHR